MKANPKIFKLSSLLIMLLLVFSLTACGNTSSQPDSGQAQTTAAAAKEDNTQQGTTAAKEASSAAKDSDNTTNNKTLVVFFSATGTTKGVAEKIASAANADTYEILAAQPYTDADLNWNDSNSRTTKEQNDKSVRPEIGSDKASLDGYSTVFIGYPIWWGEEPRIMDTFVESYDFSGKTVIPFCTSGGSGIGSSGTNLASNAGSGNWLEGERLSTDSDIDSWVKGLNLSN
jgi:flavodoxin